jgi:heptaprenyl diphosphate synthase
MSYWLQYPEIQNELLKVEAYMKKAVISKNPEITHITKELIESGGKRIRPAFVILAAQLGKTYKESVIIPLAASIELIHTATLVHDDIIDEATFRRGKRSVQDKWGRDMAIYIGDYLLTKSFLLLSEETSFQHIKYVAKLIKAICEGEIKQYQIRYQVLDTMQYLKNIYRKTALLFGMSLNIGAYEAKAKKEIVRALTQFGSYYGMAFQIYDDLLDYTSSETLIGKPVGQDLKQGYYTLPLLYAIKDSTYGETIEALLNKKEKMTDEELETVFSLIKKTKALEESKILLNKVISKAKQSLEPLNQTPVRAILEDLIQRLNEI